jgi:hypothetical protein
MNTKVIFLLGKLRFHILKFKRRLAITHFFSEIAIVYKIMNFFDNSAFALQLIPHISS